MTQLQQSIETVPDLLSLKSINAGAPLRFSTMRQLESEVSTPLVPMEAVETIRENSDKYATNFKQNTSSLSENLSNNKTNLVTDLDEFVSTLWQNHQRTFDEFFQTKKDDLAALRNQIDAISSLEEQKDWVLSLQRLINPHFVAMDLNILWSFISFQDEYELFLDRLIAKGVIKIKHPYEMEAEHLNSIFDTLNQRVIHLATEVLNYQEIYCSWVPQLNRLSNENRLCFTEIAKQWTKDLDGWHHILKEIAAEQTKLEAFMKKVYRSIYSHFSHSLVKNMTLQSKQVDQISLVNNTVTFTYKKDEWLLVTDELNRLFKKIEGNLVQKEWQQAKLLLENLQPIIQANPRLQQMIVMNKNNAFYTYELYQFVAKVGQLLDSSPVTFVQGAKRMIASESSFKLNDADFVHLHIPTKFNLSAQLIHTAISIGEEKQLITVFDDVLALIVRHEHGEIQGENPLNDDFLILQVLVAQYLREKIDHPFISICNHHDLTEEVMTSVLLNYKKIVGNDALFRYFNKSIFNKMIDRFVRRRTKHEKNAN